MSVSKSWLIHWSTKFDFLIGSKAEWRSGDCVGGGPSLPDILVAKAWNKRPHETTSNLYRHLEISSADGGAFLFSSSFPFIPNSTCITLSLPTAPRPELAHWHADYSWRRTYLFWCMLKGRTRYNNPLYCPLGQDTVSRIHVCRKA